MNHFESTVGFILSGVLASVFMFGILTFQVYAYFRTYPQDKPLLKSLILIIWFLELGTAICVSVGIFTIRVSDFGHTDQLLRNPNSLNAAILLGGITDHLVKTIFIYRLYRLTNTLYLPGFLSALSLCLFTIIVIAASKILRNIPLQPHSAEFEWIIAVTFVGSALQDVVITSSLCYFFQKERKSVFKRTALLLDRLVCYTIQSGAATSLVAISAAISFFSMEDNYAWMMFFLLMHSSFSNALLSSLNIRAGLHRMREANQDLLMTQGILLKDQLPPSSTAAIGADRTTSAHV